MLRDRNYLVCRGLSCWASPTTDTTTDTEDLEEEPGVAVLLLGSSLSPLCTYLGCHTMAHLLLTLAWTATPPYFLWRLIIWFKLSHTAHENPGCMFSLNGF